jgi:Tfp pilus assembly protein PilN
MIEINLLPGARKKTRSAGASAIDVRALLGSLGERFKDPWLGIAVAGAAIGIAAVAFMYLYQGRVEAQVNETVRVAEQDSIRFDNVLAQRRAAEAQRDSIMRQMTIIAAIDGERFTWAHVMDEISRALPTYTWLQSVAQGNAAGTVSPEAVAAGTAPRLSVRIIGYTVNIQALTIFMRNLEASPFLENVTLAVSEVASVEGKQVTEFTVDVMYAKPDSTAIRTAPLTIAVR